MSKKDWLKGGEKRAREAFFWFVDGLSRHQKEGGFSFLLVEEEGSVWVDWERQPVASFHFVCFIFVILS